jgi:hypothetical protein
MQAGKVAAHPLKQPIFLQINFLPHLNQVNIRVLAGGHDQHACSEKMERSMVFDSDASVATMTGKEKCVYHLHLQ